LIKPSDVIDVINEESEAVEVELPEHSQREVNSNAIFESDEDRIISILKEHEGVMMQSEIVKKTRFSKAKTSSLLSKMAGAGVIQRVRKGRENLIRVN
jgi:uncharacterized membrane protein